jgi:hypothetical protein
MQSATILKHSIHVKRSFYAGIVIFALYGSAILLLLLFVGVTWLTSFLYFILLGIALFGVRKAYLQTSLLKLSDAGYVEIEVNGKIKVGFVSCASFYNGLFISLNIEPSKDDFLQGASSKPYFIVIYRDAVSEFEYRLLARIINFGRE